MTNRLRTAFLTTPLGALLAFVCTICCLPTAASSQVINGNFDSGNAGFTSDAAFVAAGLLAAGDYSIRTDPSTANGQWCGNEPPPVGATGNVFVCDGISGSPTVAWRQTVAVTPGGAYDFSVQVRNLQCVNNFTDPVIELRVNGQTVAGPTPILEDPDPDQWQVVSGTFAACGSLATLEIVTTSTVSIGNDFALDDVTLELSAGSLAVNGDFDAGNVGFTSDATFVAAGLLASGEYSIRTDPSTANNQWCGNDHTPGGNGNFFVCDGISGSPTAAWRQTLSVTAGRSYRFGAWVKNLLCANDFDDPVIELRVDGATIAGPLTLSEDADPDQWEFLIGEFTPCGPTVTLEIVTTSTASIGNDFAIDDVTVQETCCSSIVNGDFSAGNSDFTSSAAFEAAGLLSQGEYSIRSDPSTGNSQWCGNDPTTPGGSFFVCDGFSGMPTIAWSQTVAVDLAEKYYFSVLARNLICTTTTFDDPILELRITDSSGTRVVSGPTALAEDFDPDHWLHLAGTFQPVSSPVTLEIVSTSTAGVGNDFALDEIELKATCPIFCDGFESGDTTAWQ